MSSRPGLLLAANVLGVGALFLPWTATAAFGPAAVVGWGYHVLAGAVLVAALAGLRAGESGGLELIESALGRTPARAISACYVVGITAGQVVVALVAGDFLAQASGLPGSAIGWLAVGVLAGSVLVARGNWAVAALPLLGVLVGLLVATPGLAVPATSVATPGLSLGAVGSAVAMQCFVVVGWESAGRFQRSAVLGVGLVGVLYLGALLLAPRVGLDRNVFGLALPELSGGAGQVVALLLGGLAAFYCARNVRTVGRLVAGPAGSRQVAVLAGAVAGLGVGLVRAGLVPATTVLAVPNAMACAVFLTVGLAAVRSGRRLLGLAAMAAYLPVLWFLGPMVLAPVVVAGVAVLLRRKENTRATAVPRLVRAVRGDRDRSGRR